MLLTYQTPLHRSGVKTLPDNAKVHYNYGNYLKDIGNSQEAILHYKKSLQSVVCILLLFHNLKVLQKYCKNSFEKKENVFEANEKHPKTKNLQRMS